MGEVPSGNLAKLLEEAERMVNEMENKNFTPPKTAAEKEREEAKKCRTLKKPTASFSVPMCLPNAEKSYTLATNNMSDNLHMFLLS